MLTDAGCPSVFVDGRYDWGNSYFSTTYGPAKIIFMNSYTASHVGSNQYQWMESELRSIDRRTTPWLFVVVHCPIYNTFENHHDEAQTIEFKEAMEPLFVKHHVNIVFSGHEHAYMMSRNVAFGSLNVDGPQYIIIGDGGNREGLGHYFNPDIAEGWVLKRDITSFGFGALSIKNSTHAEWNWIPNDDVLTTGVSHNEVVLNRFLVA
uniref:Acid phosphatase n=1 Tax=Leptocylindrus danicus TaxID=163516 RepID=A0A7S2JQG5_9STRA